jgi:hypothetical protein
MAENGVYLTSKGYQIEGTRVDSNRKGTYNVADDAQGRAESYHSCV